MAFLQGPSLKQAEVMKQEWGEGLGDLERGVQDLQSMLAATPYLPDPGSVDTHLLGLFVRGCRMDLERARNKLESFFLSRSRFRDLYDNISLKDPPLSEVCKYMDIAPLPKVTDEGYRVTVFRLQENCFESSVEILHMVQAILLVSDIRMHDETLIAGDVFIWEISNLKPSLVAKLLASANTVRRSVYLAQAAYPQRMKRIHVVGARPVVTSVIQLMRSCVNEKIKRRYYIHAKAEELLEHIPARVLPKDLSGEEESIDTLARRWRHRSEELKDYLQNLKELCNATPAPIMDADIYGTVGAFRKLDID
ncbi:unnamed protein product [Diatraea saccharalis]|uniref:CRAL-TRIO domain-containing protein n=1 Tax=Diatraea saccharalis TaxID=40085 RepID=A0A9N9R6W4_9NEOP|nr:unnamed protein product [Diatraea saccharalis]